MAAPLSVVCTNDTAARGLYEAAAERGLVVGRDVAVVSFDDLLQRVASVDYRF